MPTIVKICGLTNRADAEVAVEAGADFLGFIFYPKSPRYVTPDTVRPLLASLREHAGASPLPRTVGIFVNAPTDQIQAILKETGIDYAQLHGDETPYDLEALAGRGYKALRPHALPDALYQAALFAPHSHAPAPQLLLDAFSPTAYGGTGHRADWEIAAQLARLHPRLLLAGGLDPSNVAEALAAVRPWGVDISSGVEAAPGRKNHDKVRAFLAAVRSADV